MAKLLYQGHGSFRLISSFGTVIFIDPFMGEGYDVTADAAISSHEHPDHAAFDIITLKDSGKIYRSSDFLHNGIYEAIDISDVKVSAVPACNANHPIDKCVGFLIEVDSVKLYIAGDTSKTDYMQTNLSKEALDYAFLPCDGMYNMGTAEASECALIIGAKHSTPIHMAPGKLFDEDVAAAFEAKGKLVMIPSEEIDL